MILAIYNSLCYHKNVRKRYLFDFNCLYKVKALSLNQRNFAENRWQWLISLGVVIHKFLTWGSRITSVSKKGTFGIEAFKD